MTNKLARFLLEAAWLIALALLGAIAMCAFSQTTITLKGSTYTLKAPPIAIADGAGGVIDTAMAGPKAISGNPAWVALMNNTAVFDGSFPYTDHNNQQLYQNGMGAAQNAAMCRASTTTYAAQCTVAKTILLNLPAYYPWLCNDQTVPGNCEISVNPGYDVGSYGVVYWMWDWVSAFETMIATGQLSSGDEQQIADYFLNDLAAYGGISGSHTTDCTNPTAVTAFNVSVNASTGVITSTSPVFGSGQPIQLNYWVDVSTNTPAQVVSITDSTHATIDSRSFGTAYTGVLGYRRNTWVAGDCGILWLGKHGTYGPQSINYVSGAPAYPASGPAFDSGHAGGQAWDPGQNNTYAMYQGFFAALLATVQYDVNASTRSQLEITALYDDWHDNQYIPYMQQMWTGMHPAGYQYGPVRPPQAIDMNSIVQMSLTAPPNLGGNWTIGMLKHFNEAMIPGSQSWEAGWGQTGEGSPTIQTYLLAYMLPNYFVNRNTIDGEYFNWEMQHYFSAAAAYGNPPGTNLLWTSSALGGAATANDINRVYEYTDPAFTAVDITAGGPTAVALNQVDVPSGIYPQSAFFSRTGFTSVTDTLVSFFGMGEYVDDHNCRATSSCAPGTYKIMMANTMLGNDDLNGIYNNISNDYTNGCGSATYLEIGGACNVQPNSVPLDDSMPRASTPSNNKYAYAMEDGTLSYTSAASPTLVQTHLIQFKEGQGFVFVFHIAKTSAGKQKQLYLHYANNNNLGAPVALTSVANNVGGATTLYNGTITGGTSNGLAGLQFTVAGFSGGNNNGTYTATASTATTLTLANGGGTAETASATAAEDATRGATTVSGNSVTSSTPGTGHSDAAQLLTAFLPMDGANSIWTHTDNPNGTYSGGNGSTYRISVCASTTGTTCNTSNLTAHIGVIHEPVAGTSNTMPATSVLSADVNHMAMQVAGSSPKVAIFPVDGGLYNSTSVVSTFSGTGQYLVTGLTPNAYTATINGTNVVSADVNANDNTLYFEGGSGSVVISSGGPPTAAAPTFSPVAGTYGSTQNVTISTTTSGAAICYTTDGSTPLAASPGTCSHGTTYSGAVSVASSLTINAIATKSGLTNSGVGSAAYTINVPAAPRVTMMGPVTVISTTSL